ncbi:hypothetical protein [Psychrobacter sp. FDAARGOS_221]|uniref:hypothetical protein n=1 Tax=Psychrobacter sp. FDAARGOS_221 TaxID=1975705 RepID=UPI000BB56F6F|nr:hypothetical protein [Psychrobacter sp. FDAARGOS_221]PNK59640.1 hypothetical protein A6J60_001255 [Psychrobacter sp. FDAARGOS_221]
MNMKDMLGAVKGDNAEGNSTLSGLMDIAKDINKEDLERYKNMSKAELLEELKNSEHSEKVVALIKGLIANKS